MKFITHIIAFLSGISIVISLDHLPKHNQKNTYYVTYIYNTFAGKLCQNYFYCETEKFNKATISYCENYVKTNSEPSAVNAFILNVQKLDY